MPPFGMSDGGPPGEPKALLTPFQPSDILLVQRAYQEVAKVTLYAERFAPARRIYLSFEPADHVLADGSGQHRIRVIAQDQSELSTVYELATGQLALRIGESPWAE
jgi:hypothetical protein